MTTNIELPVIDLDVGVWGNKLNVAVAAVRDAADAAADAANALDARVTSLEAGSTGGTVNLQTFDTLTDFEAAIAADTVPDGSGVFIKDPSS